MMTNVLLIWHDNDLLYLAENVKRSHEYTVWLYQMDGRLRNCEIF